MRKRWPTGGERVRLVCLTGQLAVGGSERQVYLSLKHLDDSVFEPHVVVMNPSPDEEYAAELERMGVKIWRVPEDCRNRLERLGYVTRLLLEIQPDIVHSWNVHDNPYAGIAGFLARVPGRIGSVRGSWSSSGLQAMSGFSRYLSLFAPSMLVVNAASIARELYARGVTTSRLAVLRNVIDDYDNLPPLSREAALADLGLEGESRIVMIVGNLRRVKNHLLFIDAMAAIAPRFPEVRGVIIGRTHPTEPDWPGVLQSRVEELGLGDVIVFAGFRADVPRLLPHAAAACLTSDEEGSPNVIAEAMAAGTPVVATRVGGIPELIDDGVTGLLVEPGDTEGVSDALGRVLGDENLSRQLREAGRRSIRRHHDHERTASRLMALYLDSIRRRPARRPEWAEMPLIRPR